ncbi:MAG: ATP-binding protein [Chloroflexota bacterium]
MTYDEAIQSLILQAYLRIFRPISPGTTAHTLSSDKTDIPWYIVTEKGLEAVRLYQDQLVKEKKSAQAALDRYLVQGDIPKAIQIIRKYDALQLFPIAQLWQGENQPNEAAIRATEILLKDKLPLAGIDKVQPKKLRALRLQAAEFVLAGVMLFDRLGPKQLHPRGNAWVIDALCSYALEKAEKSIIASGIVNERSNGRGTMLPTSPNGELQQGSMVSETSLHIIPQLVIVPANLPRVRVPIGIKITIPFILLALTLAIAGAYVVSQIVFESLDDRFTNQLIEVGKLASDRMVQEEQERLKTLRLLANTNGVAAALVLEDSEQLRTLALPIAVNAHEEAIEFINMAGQSILSLRHKPGQSVEAYDFTTGDTAFAQWPFVQQVLVHQVDQLGDKYAGEVAAPWGNYFYVSGPVFDANDQLIGAILIGKSLDTMVKEFRQDTLAQTTVYDSGGQPLASSLLGGESVNVLTPQQVSNALAQQDKLGMLRAITVGSVRYSEILGPWEIRSGSDMGVIGAALPQSFLVQASSITRLQIFGILAVGLLSVIGVGVYLARRITQPLLRVVQASTHVAQGDLDVRVTATGNDEIAVLASAFNHMVAGLREATERRLREIELLNDLEREKELRELKSRFVSMVSHEFRTPLTTILSSSEFIRNYGQDTAEEKRAKHFDRIQGAVSNMKSLIDDVLFIGKTESGRLEFNPALTDLEAFCGDLVDEMQTQASAAHELRFSCEGLNRSAVIDMKLMRLAITNLLSNAIKYSPDGGRVYLKLICRSTHIIFEIIDEGLGVPEKDQPRLFETFHRAANVSNISGTGLGLYVTKMAVELHNGTINFTSQEGVGTTFIMSIPIV